MPLTQTITKTKMGQGPVILSFTNSTVGNITKVGDIDLAKKLLEVKAGNPKRTVAIFETEMGSGKVRITVNEIADWDASTVGGEQALVTIGQALPKATAKKWEYAAATAYVNVISFTPDASGDGLSEAVLEITPIAADGSTAAWTFNNDASNS
jgi:hypothetical protein